MVASMGEKGLKERAKYDSNMYSIINSLCVCACMMQSDKFEIVFIFKIYMNLFKKNALSNVATVQYICTYLIHPYKCVSTFLN